MTAVVNVVQFSITSANINFYYLLGIYKIILEYQFF